MRLPWSLCVIACLAARHGTARYLERLGAVLELDPNRPGPEVLVYRHPR